MGNYSSSDADAKKRKKSEVISVLLMGPSDSGKTTLIKQMRIIHNHRFTTHEVELYRQLIFKNIVRDTMTLVDALPDMQLQLLPENERFAEALRNVNDLCEGEAYPEEMLQPLKKLWEDSGVKAGWLRANEVALPENLQYFFEDLPRIFRWNYTPTSQDIIQCRVPTAGIIETVFIIREQQLRLIDISGRRSGRREWIHLFQGINMMLFFVSLNGYDQCLFEDFSVNQMQDAMAIWALICGSSYFRSTPIILLLNKNDLFVEKVKYSPIRRYFPDYEGQEGDAAEGRKYFRKRFLKLSQQTSPQQREIHTHFSSATDGTLLRVVMAAIEGKDNTGI